MDAMRAKVKSFVKNPYSEEVCLSNGMKKSEILTDIHLYLYASYQIASLEE
jgi:hypothetical protein